MKKELNINLSDSEMRWHIAIFWPKGYTYSGKANFNQCYLMYMQPVYDQNKKVWLTKTPKYLTVTKGC